MRKILLVRVSLRIMPYKDGSSVTDITKHLGASSVSADYGSKAQTSVLLFAGLRKSDNVSSGSFQQLSQVVLLSGQGGNCEWGALLCCKGLPACLSTRHVSEPQTLQLHVKKACCNQRHIFHPFWSC